jgi:AcrR family transcriptional regulator
MSTVAPPSRRERKKNATRDALHEAAVALTEEMGLAAVTVEAITERADVAPRTFFNHFSSKVHAVLGKDPGRAARVRTALESRPATEAPMVALRTVLLEEFLPEQTTAKELLRQYRLVRSEPMLLSALQAEFDETERSLIDAICVRTGLDAAVDVYPALVVAVSARAMRVAIMRWCEDGGLQPLEPIVLEVFDQLAHGLVPPATKGISL